MLRPWRTGDIRAGRGGGETQTLLLQAAGSSLRSSAVIQQPGLLLSSLVIADIPDLRNFRGTAQTVLKSISYSCECGRGPGLISRGRKHCSHKSECIEYSVPSPVAGKRLITAVSIVSKSYADITSSGSHRLSILMLSAWTRSRLHNPQGILHLCFAESPVRRVHRGLSDLVLGLR